MSHSQEIKRVVAALTGQHNTLSIQRPYIRFTGSIEGALLLSQIIYWSDRSSTQDGWFYKTYAEWLEEICISESVVRRLVRKFEKQGFLKTKVAKVNGNPTLHYLLIWDVFVEQFHLFLSERTSQFDRNEPVNLTGTESVNLTGTESVNLTGTSLYTSTTSSTTTSTTLIDRAHEAESVEPEQPATDSQTARSVDPGKSTAQQSASVEGSYSATPRDHFADRVKHGSHRYPELCEQGLGHVWVGPGFNDFELATLKACQQHLQRHDRPAELGDAKTYLGNLIFQRKWGQIEQRHEEGRSLQSASAASRPVDPYAPTVNGMAPSDFDEIREFYKQQYDRREANG